MLDMNGIALYNITYNIRYHTFDAASMPLNYTSTIAAAKKNRIIFPFISTPIWVNYPLKYNIG